MEGMLCDSADDCTDLIVTFRSFDPADDGLPLASLLLNLKETCSSIVNLYHGPTHFIKSAVSGNIPKLYLAWRRADL
jgi:hypothetical protein